MHARMPACLCSRSRLQRKSTQLCQQRRKKKRALANKQTNKKRNQVMNNCSGYVTPSRTKVRLKVASRILPKWTLTPGNNTIIVIESCIDAHTRIVYTYTLILAVSWPSFCLRDVMQFFSLQFFFLLVRKAEETSSTWSYFLFHRSRLLPKRSSLECALQTTTRVPMHSKDHRRCKSYLLF